MKKNRDIIMQNEIFAWIALGTAVILSIPLVMMQVSSDWNWSPIDFIVMGILIFGTASMFVLLARKIRDIKHRIAAGIAFLLAFLFIWVELATGFI